MTQKLVSTCQGVTPCRADAGSAWCRWCQDSPVDSSVRDVFRRDALRGALGG